jgi:transcriptional regulator with XRE-family HTH domain
MNSTAVPRGASEPFRQLRALRRARKLKQEDVARKAGISREAYLRAESGQADPRMSTFLAACEALGLEVVLAPQQLAADVNAFIASRNGGVTVASMAGQPPATAQPAAGQAGGFGSTPGDHKPA